MQKAKKLKIASVILCLIGILSIIIAVGYFATSDYAYYESQYWECHSGWSECTRERENYYYGSYFYEFYDLLADKWYDLMLDWKGLMTEIEITTGFIATPGVLMIFISIILRISSGKAKKKAQKELQMQQQQMAMGMMPVPGAPMAPNGFVQPMGQPMMQPMGQPMMQPMAQPMVQPMVQPVAPTMVPPVAPTMTPPTAPVSTPVAPPVEPAQAPVAPATPVASVASADVDLDEEITID